MAMNMQNFGFHFHATGARSVISDVGRINRGLHGLNRTGGLFRRAGGFMPNFTKFRSHAGGFFGYSRTQMGSMNLLAGGFGGALIAGITGALAKFKEFDKAARGAFTLLNEHKAALLGGFEGLKSKIQEVAVATGQDLVKAANAFTTALGAGVAAEALAATVELGAKLAVAGQTTADKAVTGIITIANTFGIAYDSFDEMRNISDVLFATFNFGVTSIEALSKNVFKLAPTAKAVGLSIEEMMGTVAGLTSEGRSTMLAFREMNTMLNAFLKPASMAKKKMDELGIASGETAFTVNGGFIPAILNAKKAVDESGVAVDKIFPQARAASAFRTFSSGFEQLGLDIDSFNALLTKEDALKGFAENAQAHVGDVFDAFKTLEKDGGAALEALATRGGVSVEELKEMYSGTMTEFVQMNENVGTAAASMIKQMYHPLQGMAAETGRVTEDAFNKMRGSFDFQLNQMKTNFEIFSVNLVERFKPTLAFFMAIGTLIAKSLEAIGKAWDVVFGKAEKKTGNLTLMIQGFIDKMDFFTGLLKPIDLSVDSTGFVKYLNSVKGLNMSVEDLQGNWDELQPYADDYVRSQEGVMEQAQALAKKTGITTEEALSKMYDSPMAKARNFVFNFKDAVGKVREMAKSLQDTELIRENIMKMPLGNVVLFFYDKFQQMKSIVTDFWKGFEASEGIQSFMTLIKTIATFFIDRFQQMMVIVGEIGKMFGGAADEGQSAASTVGSAFAGILDVITSVLTPIFQILGTIFKAVGAVLAGIFKQAGPVLQVLLGLVQKLATMIGGFIEKLAPSIIQIATTLGTAIGQILEALMPVINIILDQLAKFLPIIIGLVQKILPPIMRVITIIATVIADILKEVGPLLEEIFKSLEPVFDIVGDVIAMIAKDLGPILRMVGESIKPIIKALIPITKFITKIIKAVAPAIKGIVAVVGGVLKVVTAVITKITEGISWLIESIFGAEEETNVLGSVFEFVFGIIGTGLGWLAQGLDFIAFGISNIGLVFELVGYSIAYGATWLTSYIIAGFAWVSNQVILAWYEIKRGAMMVWNFILLDIIQPVIQWIVTAAYDIYNAFNYAWVTIQNASIDVFQFISNLVVDVYNGILYIVDQIYLAFQKAFNAVAGVVETVVNGILSGLELFFNKIVKAYNDSLGVIFGQLSEAKLGEVSLTVKGNFDSIYDDMKESYDDLSDLKEAYEEAEPPKMDFSAIAGDVDFRTEAEDFGTILGKVMADFSVNEMQAGMEGAAGKLGAEYGKWAGMGMADSATEGLLGAEGDGKGLFGDGADPFAFNQAGSNLLGASETQQDAANSLDEAAAEQAAAGAEAEVDKEAKEKGKKIDFQIELNDAECGKRRARKIISEQVDKQFTNWHCDVDLQRTGTT